ncbi:Branched-chain amino acid transport system ATP-binding protein OS=Castellaniella defragrans OX=75697 GN=HNR28_003052 PE=3 SV=1 [Castellaniella defragrans]
MLLIDNLSVSYGLVQALDAVSLAVKPGEFVGVIGANRAGKTTLLKAISGMVTIRSGSISWQDTVLSRLPAHRIPHFGIAHVPEGRQIFPEMSVEENLLVGASTRAAKPHRAESLEMAYQLFPRLAERRGQIAGTMSGGEQQMLAIARALMLRPSLLLLDEPSLGLAPIVVDEVYERIAEIHKLGLTTLLVEQNVHLALDHVERCYVIENGRITLQGSAAELRVDPKVQEAYLGI